LVERGNFFEQAPASPKKHDPSSLVAEIREFAVLVHRVDYWLEYVIQQDASRQKIPVYFAAVNLLHNIAELEGNFPRCNHMLKLSSTVSVVVSYPAWRNIKRRTSVQFAI
jgi:hypothetical protein